jgi:hypothetical protein
MSDDLIERLRNPDHNWHEAACAEAFTVIEAQAAEIERLKSIVRGWHYLAVGPDEMGDYYTQKQLIKASEPYASPALTGKAEQ